MTLISKNVTLRSLEPEDIELLYNWENQTDYWLDSQTLHPYSKHLLNQFLEDSRVNVFENKQLRLVISLVDCKKTIGFIDLFDLDLKNSRAAIGILIGDTTCKKKGYASEALQLMIKYAFKTLNLKQLYAEVIADNNASNKLFEKNNFRKTAVKEQWVQVNRTFLDVNLYQIFNK